MGASHLCSPPLEIGARSQESGVRRKEEGGRRKEEEGRSHYKCFYKYEMLPKRSTDFCDDLTFICNSLYNWLPKIYNSKTGKRLQEHYNLINIAIAR